MECGTVPLETAKHTQSAIFVPDGRRVIEKIRER